MRLRFEGHGRVRAQAPPALRAALLALLPALLFLTGCGTRRTEPVATKAHHAAESKAAPAAGAKNAAKSHATAAMHPAVASAGGGTRVLLSEKGCIELEPHWTSIRLGQSLTWHSNLHSPVTIHVSPGAFDRTQFVVPAGASVNTSSARSAGSF